MRKRNRRCSAVCRSRAHGEHAANRLATRGSGRYLARIGRYRGISVVSYQREWAEWHPCSPPADDPRLTITTPFQNVRPGVRYVGDEACADCHPSITTSFRLHPMGDRSRRSRRPSVVGALRGRKPQSVRSGRLRVSRRPGETGGSSIANPSEGGGVESRAEMAFAVGSGRRGRSYLIDHDGFLFQSPHQLVPSEKHLGFVAGLRRVQPALQPAHYRGVPVLPLQPGRARRSRRQSLCDADLSRSCHRLLSAATARRIARRAPEFRR